MKLLITGLGGTLAPRFAERARGDGWKIVGWNRAEADPENPDVRLSYLEKIQPDAIFHLGMGSEHWAGFLAGWAAGQNVPFLFTSSVMVFANSVNGPFRVDRSPDAVDEYGRYKIRCEQEVMRANPRALIVRLGWQFDHERRGNNMFAQLSQQMKENRVIRASSLWIPACSHMIDSADVSFKLFNAGQPGIWHIDGNYSDGLSYHVLISRIRDRLNLDWKIEATSDFEHDQRLADDRIRVPSILDRLEKSAGFP